VESTRGTNILLPFSFDLALLPLEDGASDSGYFRCSLQLGWFISFASRSGNAKKPWLKILNTTSKDDVIATVDSLVEHWLVELPEHRERDLELIL
jgi:hypothetical protein